DAQHALSIARSAYRSSSIQASIARLQLADVYVASGQVNRAAQMLPATISAIDRLNESDSSIKSRALVLLGNALKEQDKYSDAIEKFDQARELQIKSLHKDPLIAAQALVGLADVYNTRAKHDKKKAETIYKRALTLMLRSQAREESQVLYIMDNLSRIFRESGRVDETEKLYKMVEHVDKSTGKTSGLIEDKLLLGQLYREKQDLKQARDNIENALSLSQAFYGARSAKACEITAILAETYIWQNDFVKAHGLVSDAVLMLRSDNLTGKLSRQAKLQVLSTYRRYLERTGKSEQAASVQKELEHL
ncbi:MAG: tetratricopeptide repeat protein, partial [Candidatus Obscuribacterales bacterium]|nr:tetratricopeptide repeat protein [Candidatus Obscuribacterales bacterium]